MFDEREIIERIKLYLAGLIAADGHLEQNGYIIIAQKDKRFIDIIAGLFTRINVKVSSIFYDRMANVWKIKVRDPELYTYLLKMGLTPGRKYDRIMPPRINAEKALPYIIGFIDGDGWIEQVIKTRKGKKYHYMRIGIKTKSRQLRDWIINVLKYHNINAHKADKRNGYEIHIDTLLAWKIASLLLNPRHKEKIMLIRDDRVLKS